MRFRCSSAVEAFGKMIKKSWGIDEWRGVDDETEEVLFFGLYNDEDYDAYRIWQGKRSVFWCGSDITRLLNSWNYQRIVRLFSAKHYCENEVEQKELKSVGIDSEIIPSFLDDIHDYSCNYRWSAKPHVFICGHNDREDEYGLDTVRRIADRVDAIFHIYGISHDSTYFDIFAATKNSGVPNVKIDSDFPNIWYHGKVPREQFNKEIKKYQCGLRTNEHDGNSEVTMKCILNGGYPITRIKYPDIWNYTDDDELVELINKLKEMKEPNLEARSSWIKRLNQFPWCKREYLK